MSDEAWEYNTTPAFLAELEAAYPNSLPFPEEGDVFFLTHRNTVLLIEHGGLKIYLRPQEVRVLRDALNHYMQHGPYDETIRW